MPSKIKMRSCIKIGENMFQVFLIKYAEIALKGKNRFLFEDALVKQINIALRRIEGDYKVVKQSGRIYVTADLPTRYDDVINALSCVFGIVQICPVAQTSILEFEELKKYVVEYVSNHHSDMAIKTFKVDCRRAVKNYPITSMEINAKIGEVIIDEFPGVKVDVHHPEIVIHIELREKLLNVYSLSIPGPGGMPIGTNGKAMLLLSGGIDSPVAGYMIAKRGVKLEATYFHAPPYTSERAKQKVIDLAQIIAKYAGPITINIINFTDIQLYIYEKCPHEELTIIMRRYMMKIAQKLAEDNNSLGLVTGESIGQVASQTMQSLAATNEVCTLPVYRPLIGFDKQEIVSISKKIDAYETSILPFEDCCTIFVAKHPVTKPLIEKIKNSEKNLAEKIDELVSVALETKEVVWVK